jgi:hypothetical protein
LKSKYSAARLAAELGSAGHGLLLRAARKYSTVELFAGLLQDAAVDVGPADPFVQRAAD